MAVTLRPSRPAHGWLVLIGGADSWPPTEAIDRAALERMPDGPIAFVPAAGCEPAYGKSFLATYRGLGAPEGYVVPVTDVTSAREPANVALLKGAALIYFGGGDTTRLLATMTNSPALEAGASAYEHGAVICGMSAGAIAVAAHGVTLNAGVLEGWGWLPDTLVSVHHTPARDELLAHAHRDHPETISVALPELTALAIGPDGEMEEWGERGIVIKAGAGT